MVIVIYGRAWYAARFWFVLHSANKWVVVVKWAAEVLFMFVWVVIFIAKKHLQYGIRIHTQSHHTDTHTHTQTHAATARDFST